MLAEGVLLHTIPFGRLSVEVTSEPVIYYIKLGNLICRIQLKRAGL
jgi:hypothetical protein